MTPKRSPETAAVLLRGNGSPDGAEDLPSYLTDVLLGRPPSEVMVVHVPESRQHHRTLARTRHPRRDARLATSGSEQPDGRIVRLRFRPSRGPLRPRRGGSRVCRDTRDRVPAGPDAERRGRGRRGVDPTGPPARRRVRSVARCSESDRFRSSSAAPCSTVIVRELVKAPCSLGGNLVDTELTYCPARGAA